MDDELVGGVVVGTDGSAQGGAALEYGVREAQRRGTSLTVVHVATDYVPVAPMMPLIPEDLKALGRTILDEALRTVSGLAPDLDVRTVLRSGAAVPELVRVSAEASVLVLGHEMTPAWQRLFTGAVTVGVAEQARCPVVTVPTAWEPAAARREVVVGLKSLEHAPGLLSHAVATAADRGASLTVVHTWSCPSATTTSSCGAPTRRTGTGPRWTGSTRSSRRHGPSTPRSRSRSASSTRRQRPS